MNIKHLTLAALLFLLLVPVCYGATSILVNGTKFNSNTPTLFTLDKPLAPNWEVSIQPNLQYNLSTSKIYIDILNNPKNDLTTQPSGSYQSSTGFSRIRIKVSADGSVPIIYYLTNSSENNEVVLYQGTENVLGEGSTSSVKAQNTIKVFWVGDKLTISVFDGNKEVTRLVNGLTLTPNWNVTHIGVWSDETPTPVKAGYVTVLLGTPTTTFYATDLLTTLIPLIVLAGALMAVVKILKGF
ncbi:MAG: hypothetical protein H5T50_03820 [Nitrososphaeria archaeon]|nr:hypothetical protein [Nitrososphaeria archaeon]